MMSGNQLFEMAHITEQERQCAAMMAAARRIARRHARAEARAQGGRFRSLLALAGVRRATRQPAARACIAETVGQR